MRPRIAPPVWDGIVVFATTIVAILAPAVLVLDLSMTGGLLAIEWIATVVLVVDVVVRLRRRGSSSEGGWAWLSETPAGTVVDVVAAVPLGIILGVGTAWPLIRLVKLLRVAEAMHDWRYRAIERAALLRLVFFIYWLGLIAHWIACGWIALDDAVRTPDAWTTYLDGIYWTITTLSTVGYGDITPVTAGQRVFTIGVMVLGLGVYGFIIGNVATIVFNLDPARALHRQRIEQLSTFMANHDIPTDLRDRTVEYYRYRWRNRLDHDESEVLRWLSPPLRAEVAAHLNRDLIRHVPMFRDASDAFLQDVTLELKLEVLMPGDVAVRAGDRARAMYFVSRGALEVVSADTGERLRTLTEGDFFGEIALVYDEVRTASVRAIDFCHVYRLDRDLFERVLQDWPDVAAEIRARADQRRGTI
jgi:hypothetical protein